VLVFTAIPFIAYLVRFQKKTDFLTFIGMIQSPAKANGYGLLLMLVLGLPLLVISFLDPAFLEILTGPGTVSGTIRQMGFGVEGVLTVILYAVFKTALAEEILFRGFIAKRFIALMGFRSGNIVQAVLFGAIHTLLFLTLTDNFLFLVIFFIIPGGVAYLMVLINEKELQIFIGLALLMSVVLSVIVALSDFPDTTITFLRIGAMLIPAFCMLVMIILFKVPTGPVGWNRFPIKWLLPALFLIPLTIHLVALPTVSLLNDMAIPWQSWLIPGTSGTFDASPMGWGQLDPVGLVFRLVQNALIGLLIVTVLSFFEEIGWRVWMLPRLIDVYDLRTGVFISACIWAVWHIPFVFGGMNVIPGISLGAMLVLYPVGLVGAGMVLGWLWVETRSIWIICLGHGALNNWGQYAFKFMKDGPAEPTGWPSGGLVEDEKKCRKMKNSSIIKLAIGVVYVWIGLVFLSLAVTMGIGIHWSYSPTSYENLYLVNGFQAGLNSFNIKVSHDKLTNICLADLEAVTLYWLLFRNSVILVIWFFGLRIVLNVLRSMRDLKTFYIENIRSFRRLAFLGLLSIGIAFFNFGIIDGGTLWNFTIPFGEILFTVMCLVLSEVFSEGFRLLEDSDSIV
ncbi:unnamed protein product, partial [Symbiodinium microadriaticum]